jgi:peroxiredoxin
VTDSPTSPAGRKSKSAGTTTAGRTIELRKLAAMVIAGGLTSLLLVQYVRLLRPAAAREIQAACGGLRPSPTNPAYGKLPAQAIDFSAQDHTGKTVSLKDFRGKIVFVNFWASWCDVCRSEKPSLEAMTRRLGGDDFVVLALASDDSWDKVRESLPKGVPFRVLLDPPAEGDTLGRIARSYGITAVPESFVIDRDGRVRHYFINKRDWKTDVAETCLSSLLDE